VGGTPFEHPPALPFDLPKLTGREFRDSGRADAFGTAPLGWSQGVGPLTGDGLRSEPYGLGCVATGTVAWATDVVWADCVIETIPLQWSAWNGIALRVQPSALNLYFAAIYGGSGLVIYNYLNGGFSKIASAPSATLQQRMSLRFSAVGGLLTASYGQWSVSVTDGHIPNGAPGVYCDGGAQYAYIRACRL